MNMSEKELLVEAVKALRGIFAQLEELEEDQERLEAKLADLESDISRLEYDVEELKYSSDD